jgi:quinoprotein glucose dehydrogenase
MPVYESDICIIGAGISAAMLAQKLSELRPRTSITIVEAGRSLFDFENRFQYRDRMAKYGENPWPGDFIEGQAAAGGISRTMAVGGQALPWGGTCNRFSEGFAFEIDVRSLRRLAVRRCGDGKVLL